MITFDVASTIQGFADFRQWAHTIGAGDYRILLVGGTTNALAPTTATYDGVAMDLLATFNNAGGAQCKLFYMIDPPEGPHNVRVNFGGNGSLTCSAVSYFGVDSENPFGTYNTASADSTTPSVVVTSEDGDLVVDFMGFRVSSTTMVAGALQTERVNDPSGVGDHTGAGMSEEVGAASVTMSWTLNNSGQWAICAVPLRPLVPFLARPVEYTLDVWDHEQRIFDANGHEVPRYKIKPNNWCRIVGLESTTAEVYESNYDDPTLVYFESVTYDGEMDQVQIVTNRGDLPEVILARLASGSTG